MKYQFTSESVTAAHPDKLCDMISDSILDALLTQDPATLAAVETTACPSFVHIMGEVTTRGSVDYETVAREAIAHAGYTKDEYLFTDKVRIVKSIHRQSQDIARAIKSSAKIGAGDQGMMFGYATNECENALPLTINLARKLTVALTEARRNGEIAWLRPDGKSQVTVEYVNGKAKRIAAVVLSAQHDEDVGLEDLRKELKEKIIIPSLPEKMIDEETRFLINPSGRFVLGGPAADTGLTGRKTIVDTYGGWAPHGGGAFSGKDATKVDRSASYAARNIALHLVKSRIADRALVQLAYAIGTSEPVSIYVNTFGTSLVSDDRIASWIPKAWDLSPLGMIRDFSLDRPQYAILSETGHFGGDQSWEKLDEEKLAQLKKLIWKKK